VAAGGGLGLLNVASRFLGGAASDLAARLRGMRGRLWVLQAVLLLEGVFCLLVGIVHDFLPATVSVPVVQASWLAASSVVWSAVVWRVCSAYWWASCTTSCLPW
jgi:hypothetical protein